MKITLLKLARWGDITAGQGTVHEVHDAIAAKLIARGYAEKYSEEDQVELEPQEEDESE
jgi:hypothetical protein